MFPDVLEGPSAGDLAAIECEWPLIEAEIAVVDAEARIAAVHPFESEIDWRRLRRTQAAVLRQTKVLFDRSARGLTPGSIGRVSRRSAA